MCHGVQDTLTRHPVLPMFRLLQQITWHEPTTETEPKTVPNTTYRDWDTDRPALFHVENEA